MKKWINECQVKITVSIEKKVNLVGIDSNF